MKMINVIADKASDGTISVMMADEMFAGMGTTVEEAIADMKQGIAFYIETAKENGFPYKEYLDGDFEVTLEYAVC